MDIKELGDALLGAPAQKRDEWFNLLKDPVFQPIYNYANWEEQRNHPLRKMQAIQRAKVMSIRDFATDPHNIFTAHEFCGMVDASLAIKFTV